MSKIEEQLKDKYGEEEGLKRYLELKAKRSATLKERHRLKKLEDPLASAKSNPRSIHFYLSRGYTEEEGRILLEKYIKLTLTK